MTANKTKSSKKPSKKHGDYIVEKQVGHLLRRAHQRHCSIFAETTDNVLTPVQFAALAMIQQCESVSQNHLGRLVSMDPATIQGVVGRLSERGFIVSTDDPDDRRRHLWALTPSGKRLLNKLVPVAKSITQATLAPLSQREQATFLRLLDKLS